MDGDLHVEVGERDIIITMPGTSIITMPGTSFRVVYRKPFRTSQLVARLDYFQNQQKGPITRAQFRARASKLANEKARELGWIA